ncbi:MAG: helix-hairpin-helix domain-containing protein [Algicola sp.]|nr:helix-hairpin-helix domain-containing protein [Algicola sp.]
MRKQSHFRFNKQERSGIFFLLLVVIVLQVAFFWLKANPSRPKSSLALNFEEQKIMDSLIVEKQQSLITKMYPFNPNYISDYKGYILGLSAVELDRLSAFRQKGKFVNSSEEFQAITQVSDSLLGVLSPHFQFPNWKKHNQTQKKALPKPKNRVQVRGLNTATADDLMVVYGIGEKLSRRIIKFRDRLGGFSVNEQLYDVYGLKPEVVEEVLRYFQVLEVPTIKKINLNTATAKELSQLIYIRSGLAGQIVAYREKNGLFKTFQELTHVDGFPTEKLDRIALYLFL